MVIEVRPSRSVAEVAAAVDLLDRIFAAHEGWSATRDRRMESYSADPALLTAALDDGRVVGAVGSSGAGIDVVGVDPAYRGQGIARRLLAEAEDTLRQRGARSIGLGSVDDAVGFYLRCGYMPQLLIQFRPEVESPQCTVKELLTGTLHDREVFESEYEGSPQLWVQVDTVDFAFKEQIEAAAAGVVAQYIMSKKL